MKTKINDNQDNKKKEVRYADQNDKTVREQLDLDVETDIATTSISILASQVIKNPVDMTMITCISTSPEQFALFTQDDATLSLFHSIRSEQIAGWT